MLVYEKPVAEIITLIPSEKMMNGFMTDDPSWEQVEGGWDSWF